MVLSEKIRGNEEFIENDLYKAVIHDETDDIWQMPTKRDPPQIKRLKVEFSWFIQRVVWKQKEMNSVEVD